MCVFLCDQLQDEERRRKQQLEEIRKREAEERVKQEEERRWREEERSRREAEEKVGLSVEDVKSEARSVICPSEIHVIEQF